MRTRLTRRRFVQLAAAGASLLAAPAWARQQGAASDRARANAAGAERDAAAARRDGMIVRAIPRSGERLPAVGLGTWQTFDVGDDRGERAPLAEVLRRFFGAGGKVIDSSPMYGRAESVVGDLLAAGGHRESAFLATKVWTTGQGEGEAQMRESERRMRAGTLDLLQVHNLVDWRTHLATLRAWKDQGKVRYLGVTHYALSAFDELERILREEQIDFVQLPYSIAVREAEKRLLAAAAETGTAVIVMRPFEAGSLFSEVRARELPSFAREIGCASWAQYFLKWILGHPAVTCAIPATSKPKHLEDNMGAGRGALPDEALRRRMQRELGL